MSGYGFQSGNTLVHSQYVGSFYPEKLSLGVDETSYEISEALRIDKLQTLLNNYLEKNPSTGWIILIKRQ